jgi:hypothetical protein
MYNSNVWQEIRAPKEEVRRKPLRKKTKWNVRFYFSKNNFSDDAHFEI